MRKVWSLMLRAFQSSIEFRSELGLWILLDTFPTILLLLVWQAIYAGQNIIRGYDFSQLVQYYLLALVIRHVITAHYEERWVQKIREGKIDLQLTKPFSFLLRPVIEDLGSKLLFVSLVLPSMAIILLITYLIWQVGLAVPSLEIIIFFILLLAIGLVVESLYSLVIVLLGFWFEGAAGLVHFKWITITLFSGSLLPIAMMPGWLQTTTNWLPFKYTYYVPIQVWLGNYSWSNWDTLNLIVFVSSLLLIIGSMWHFAKQKYASAGG